MGLTVPSSSNILVEYLPVILVSIMLIALVVKEFDKRKKNNTESQDASSGFSGSQRPQVTDNTEAILEALVPKDPKFDGDVFISWAKDVFVALQTAWTERDWDKVRLFESESLYQQHAMQLQEYCNLGRINVIEKIHFKKSYLQQYILESEYEYLVVYFDVNMIDYIKDEKTNQVIKGRPSEPCNMRYLYTFMRKRGVLTDPEKSGKLSNCPHCGAPIHVTAAGQCEYCGYIVTTAACDWVLSDIRGLRPDESVFNSAVFYR